MLDESALTTQPKISRESCKRSCQAIDLCHAFVYEASSKNCYIHSKIISEDNIKEAAGKVFGLKYCSGNINNNESVAMGINHCISV